MHARLNQSHEPIQSLVMQINVSEQYNKDEVQPVVHSQK